MTSIRKSAESAENRKPEITRPNPNSCSTSCRVTQNIDPKTLVRLTKKRWKNDPNYYKKITVPE